MKKWAMEYGKLVRVGPREAPTTGNWHAVHSGLWKMDYSTHEVCHTEQENGPIVWGVIQIPVRYIYNHFTFKKMKPGSQIENSFAVMECSGNTREFLRETMSTGGRFTKRMVSERREATENSSEHGWYSKHDGQVTWLYQIISKRTIWATPTAGIRHPGKSKILSRTGNTEIWKIRIYISSKMTCLLI